MTRRKHKVNREQCGGPLAASHGAKPQAVSAEFCADRLRPWLLCGMTALLVARPLFPSEAATEGDGLPVVMLWLALGVFWLLGAIGRRKFALRCGWTDAAVLLLVVCTTVSSLWALKYGTPRPAVNMLWEWIGLATCFFLARQFIVTPRKRRAVATVMVALAVGISAYGLYQVAYEMPARQARYEADPDRALREDGLWYAPNSPGRKAFEDRLANRQPTATFVLTNSLAALLAPWAVMLVGVVGSSLRNRKRLAAMCVCLIPIAACLILTNSRSGYAGGCVGILLAWILGRDRKKREGDNPIFAGAKIGTVPWKLPAVAAGVAALILAAAVAIKGPAVLGRAEKSFGYRLQYWRSTLDMIAARPWLGCGPGNFQEVYTRYKLPEASEEIADPHNFLLEVWATAGTPAALAFLAVLGFFVAGVRGKGPGARGRSAVGSRQSAVMRGERREERGEGETLPPSALRLPPSALRPHPSALRLPPSALRPQPSANPQSPIPNPSPDGWLHILGGGMLGFLLSVPLGMLSTTPSSLAAVAIGLPLAAATVAAMLGWIRAGELPRWLPGVAAVAILVSLSAAGGIAMPGVAATFWLLLALGLEGRPLRLLPAAAAWAGLTALLTLAVACYATAYEPVLSCQAELQLAERHPDRAVAHLQAAAAADPLSAEPWQQLAAAELEAYLQQPDRAALDRFTRAKDEALQRAPNSADLWMVVGDWEFSVFALGSRAGRNVAGDALRSAIAAYGQAVQLYPNSALCHAKLAEAYFAAADRAAFAREADIALRLDQITPHLDKKLPSELRERLRERLKRGG